ncbi:MAG TPA: hypothetical protein VMV05_06685 [bacterium]|nr:hypothetical protein [bacterium]
MKRLLPYVLPLMVFLPSFPLADEGSLAPAASTPPPYPLYTPDPVEMQNTLADADNIFQQIARVRGMDARQQPPIEFEDREFFRRYFTKNFQEQIPPERADALVKASMALGFLDRPADIIRAKVDETVEGVKGIYDPETKILYLADWIDPRKWEGVLAHEMVHALQDQVMDLKGYFNRMRSLPTDEQYAWSSVVEGEATALAYDYQLKKTDLTKSFLDSEDIAKSNRTEMLITAGRALVQGEKSPLGADFPGFAYAYGAAFLQKYIKEKGWEGMAELYAKPPQSTEQVMNPAKYFRKKERPYRIKIDGLEKGPLAGYRKIWQDVLGAYGLKNFLNLHLAKVRLSTQMKGWRGDVFQLYEEAGSEDRILLGYVILDGEDDADGFYNDCRRAFEARYGLENAGDFDAVSFRIKNPRGLGACIERRGNRVVLLDGVSPGQEEGLIKELLPPEKPAE